MRKTGIVILNEIITRITRPSFLIVTFGIPILGFLLLTVVTNLNKGNEVDLGGLIGPSMEEADMSEGFVDYSGLIKVVPSDLPAGRLIAFDDETSALEAMTNGEIRAYYLIPEDVVAKGKVDVIMEDFSPIGADDNSGRQPDGRR